MTDMVDILKKHGVRPTKLRVRILEVLISSGKSFSFTEMHKHFDEKQDRVTIYRTFNVFYDNQLIQKVVDVDGIVRFYYCREQISLCPSFRCRECGRITTLSPLPEYYRTELAAHAIDDVLLLFSGICKGCKEHHGH
ncbi:Fur family transcriptional regulator [Sphingobacterium chuzhouense]|uniref:Transcriptional repressor n=1 Tax=Sphingobacterium chuzhouense TaxID=1742264 RepID=A0ABR7XRR5_9SPHI|nr:transcriptional repressor [Sphingobacterium chuzhouense]MBD1420977.1 transcriptional repressor [Sphingobacterium chuzhouense]